jgi:hypothetical protein
LKFEVAGVEGETVKGVFLTEEGVEGHCGTHAFFVSARLIPYQMEHPLEILSKPKKTETGGTKSDGRHKVCGEAYPA